MQEAQAEESAHGEMPHMVPDVDSEREVHLELAKLALQC